MDRPLVEFKEYEDVQVLLHKLWTKYVGTEDYDKSEWRKLDNAISVLGNLAKSKMTPIR